MTRRSIRTRSLLAALSSALVVALAAPGAVAAHALNATYTSRLPLAVYLAGAAATVALSFIFVLVRDVRAERALVVRAAAVLWREGAGSSLLLPCRAILRGGIAGDPIEFAQ